MIPHTHTHTQTIPHTHTIPHTQTHTPQHTCILTHTIPALTHINTHAYSHTWTRTIHTKEYKLQNTDTHIQRDTYIHAYIHAYKRTHIHANAQTNTHTHTHTHCLSVFSRVHEWRDIRWSPVKLEEGESSLTL